ncbi:MAG: tail fiber domain-containing protein, partial [Desulfobacterales bacterium]|nr:tail fiber domain-containing protein [Desulfobacterales bacterium]
SNFFIRDATNGSKLPFRIQPGAPSSSITIRDDGDVGFGTWSPSSAMHLLTNGKAALFIFERTDGTATSGQFSAGGGNTYFGSRSDHPVHLLVNQLEKLTIDTDGEVGIGRTSPSHPLHFGSIANNAYIASDGTYHSSSSREYKEDVRALPADEALRALNDLAPVTYRYKKDAEKTRVGFIAEDVPDLVAAKDRKTLVTMDIVAVLTRVVQEQQETIREMARENERSRAELTARIIELEKTRK